MSETWYFIEMSLKPAKSLSNFKYGGISALSSTCKTMEKKRCSCFWSNFSHSSSESVAFISILKSNLWVKVLIWLSFKVTGSSSFVMENETDGLFLCSFPSSEGSGAPLASLYAFLAASFSLFFLQYFLIDLLFAQSCSLSPCYILKIIPFCIWIRGCTFRLSWVCACI